MNSKNNNFKSLYTCLLESEDLHVLYKGMTGDWEKDQKIFIKNQKALEELANIIEIDDTEE